MSAHLDLLLMLRIRGALLSGLNGAVLRNRSKILTLCSTFKNFVWNLEIFECVYIA
jgi:hypothetical protein